MEDEQARHRDGAASHQPRLAGGCASGFGPCPLDDTWRYDGAANTWQQLRGAGPSARQFAAATTLGSCPALLLFGGGGRDGSLNDLWRLDGSSWALLRTAGAAPDPRQGHSLVWVQRLGDAAGEAVVVFGGQGDSGALSDLWVLRPQPGPTRNL